MGKLNAAVVAPRLKEEHHAHNDCGNPRHPLAWVWSVVHLGGLSATPCFWWRSLHPAARSTGEPAISRRRARRCKEASHGALNFSASSPTVSSASRRPSFQHPRLANPGASPGALATCASARTCRVAGLRRGPRQPLRPPSAPPGDLNVAPTHGNIAHHVASPNRSATCPIAILPPDTCPSSFPAAPRANRCLSSRAPISAACTWTGPWWQPDWVRSPRFQSAAESLDSAVDTLVEQPASAAIRPPHDRALRALTFRCASVRHRLLLGPVLRPPALSMPMSSFPRRPRYLFDPTG